MRRFLQRALDDECARVVRRWRQWAERHDVPTREGLSYHRNRASVQTARALAVQRLRAADAAADRALRGRLVDALVVVADRGGANGCSNTVSTSEATCRRPGSGRTLDGVFGAEQWCDACVASNALQGLVLAERPARPYLRLVP